MITGNSGKDRSSERDKSPRRTPEDQERDKLVYLYLLNCLTDIDTTEAFTESGIAKKWGQQANRIYIRRILRSIFPDKYEEKDREDSIPGLTLNKLVEILTSLQKYWKEQSSKTPKGKIPRILTKQEIYQALSLFSRLFPQEQEQLNLSFSHKADILEQLIEMVTDEVIGLEDQDIVPFYKQAINIYQYFREVKHESNLKALNQDKLLEEQFSALQQQINQYVQEIINKYYQNLDQNFQTELSEQIAILISKEISRIKIQSGFQQVQEILNQQSSKLKLPRDFLSPAFFESMTLSTIENYILNDEFPIYLDYFEVERIQPLPLTFNQSDDEIGLFNPSLLEDEENQEILQGLEKLSAYKVKVYFYIKTQNWEPRFNEETQIFNNQEKRLEFFEEVRGIGSPISHIIRAINKVLLENIPCLQEYFPVAKEVLNEDQLVGETSNSPVRVYSLVKLCKNQEIEQAIEEEKERKKIIFNQSLSSGQYCSFDLVEAAAKSAFYARLRAIKQAGINAKKYMQELCNSIEEKYLYKKAESYLNFYPFSLQAMESYLNNTIFKDKYCDSQKPWSLVAYNAHLLITHAYLQEGLYRRATSYINILEEHKNKKYLDELTLAKYHFCQFRYNYHTDEKEKSSEYKPQSSRAHAIRAAEKSLEKAKEVLEKYLEKHYIIGEYFQTNIHPFFYLLSRVYAHQAKLYIFFPPFAKQLGKKRNSLIEPIYLLEKARIYAVRDGSANYYAYWTVYQSWCYLVAAYLGEKEQFLSKEFSKEKYILRAKQLIDHALLCYTEVGEKCYQEIKHNSGKETKIFHPEEKPGCYEKYYENIFVQTIPPIKESEQLENEKKLIYEDNYLRLDMSILTQSIPTKQKKDKVYLFGTYASILLFGKGIVELCDDVENKKELEEKIKNAMRQFTYCAAIATEGTQTERLSNGIYLNRKFEKDQEIDNKKMPTDFQIRGLYPHRLTNFTVLGKVFAATCKLILCLYENNDKTTFEKEINYLIKDLHDTDIINDSQDYALGQKRYNGQLESQFRDLEKYFNNSLEHQKTYLSLKELRDNVVKDIFKILRGDKVN